MKVSLNHGAVERKVVFGKKENVSIYIGNYSHEYVSIGRKVTGWEDRKKLNAGEVIEISKGSTVFEKFVLNKIKKLKDSKKVKDYKIVKSFIYSKGKKYIDSVDYDEIEAIVSDFVLHHTKGSNKKNNTADDSALRDIGNDLMNYINDFALMVICVKAMYYRDKKYAHNLEQVIETKQKIAIRNFYAELLRNNEGVDVEKIVIKCTEREDLILKDSIVIKMLLYEFAKKYYTLIERLDKDNWEDEIQWIIEPNKKGSQGHSVSKYLKAIIHVYWDFMEEKYLLANYTIEQGNYLIGKFLTLGGYEEYHEERKPEKEKETMDKLLALECEEYQDKQKSEKMKSFALEKHKEYHDNRESKKKKEKEIIGYRNEVVFYDKKLRKLWKRE